MSVCMMECITIMEHCKFHDQLNQGIQSKQCKYILSIVSLIICMFFKSVSLLQCITIMEHYKYHNQLSQAI